MVSLVKPGMKGVDCTGEDEVSDNIAMSGRSMVGIRIEYFRKFLGLQQEELAKRAGTTRKTIHEVEAGDKNRNVSKHMMIAIIAALLACEADKQQTPDNDEELKYLQQLIDIEKLRFDLQNDFLQIVRMTKEEFQNY